MSKSTVSSVATTKQAASVGSLRWKPPETFGKAGKWSTKSDIYSLGITIWEIVSRQIPFQGISDDDIPFLVKGDEERPPIPEDCYPIFKQMIEWCWQPSPDDRPSAAELLEFCAKHDQEMQNIPKNASRDEAPEDVRAEVPEEVPAVSSQNQRTNFASIYFFKVSSLN